MDQTVLDQAVLDQAVMDQAVDRTVSTVGAPAEAEAVLVEDELLVEEISIDGMCGVY